MECYKVYGGAFFMIMSTFACAADHQEARQSIVDMSLVSHLLPVLAEIVKGYCDAPYFFAQYINDEHAKAGEDITLVRISPHENLIATCGVKRAAEEKRALDTYTFCVHDALKGRQIFRKDLGFQQAHDMAWNSSSTQIASAYGNTICRNPIKYGGDKSPPYVHTSTSIRSSGCEYFVLRTPSSEYATSLQPIFARYNRKDGKLSSSAPICYSTPEGTPTCVDACAFLQCHDSHISFDQKNGLVVALSGNGKVDSVEGVTAVDFSMPCPVLGHVNGVVSIHDQHSAATIGFVQAFENMPVELLTSSLTAFVAVAQKKGKVFDSHTREQIGAFEHAGDDDPSMVVLSPDRTLVAYAAKNALYVKSIADNKELQYHEMKHPITSLYMDNNSDIIVTYDGIIHKFLKKVA